MSGDTLPFPGGGFPRPFGVPSVVGPESAAEHLRNALQLLDELAHEPFRDDGEGLTLRNAGPEIVLAVRRRVAAALAQLEPGGVEPRRGSTEDR